MNHERRHFRKSSRISGNALLAIGCLETKVNLTSQSWSLAMKSHATKRFARTASVDLRCWVRKWKFSHTSASWSWFIWLYESSADSCLPPFCLWHSLYRYFWRFARNLDRCCSRMSRWGAWSEWSGCSRSTGFPFSKATLSTSTTWCSQVWWPEISPPLHRADGKQLRSATQRYPEMAFDPEIMTIVSCHPKC